MGRYEEEYGEDGTEKMHQVVFGADSRSKYISDGEKRNTEVFNWSRTFCKQKFKKLANL